MTRSREFHFPPTLDFIRARLLSRAGPWSSIRSFARNETAPG